MIERDYRDFIRKVAKTLNRQSLTIARASGLQGNSRLLQSFRTKHTAKFDAIRFLANDYFEYVDKGRKAGGRKVPIRMIIDWLQRYAVSSPTMTTNQLAYAIQTNIHKYGIEGKNIEDSIQKNMLDTTADGLGKELEKSIADETVEAFKI